MMLNRSMLVALLGVSCCTVVDAATKVAIIEFGKRGSVRRTTATSTQTTVEGVLSFWSAVHQPNRRKLQHAGMTVVPDLFQKPDAGVVIGISGTGVDLDTMPFLSGLLSDEGSNDVVGHLEVPGSRLDSLMLNVGGVESVEASSLSESAKIHGESAGLSGFKTVVDSTNAAAVDESMSGVMERLKNLAEASGKTIILHLVVEEEVSSARRRQLSRRLEEDNADDGYSANNNGNGNNYADGDDNNSGSQQQSSLFYGYGYYDSNNRWVTPYKTMFQIQYFNIVLWTAVGLVAILFFVIQLMMYMPLEPDTLLFGESARMAGDE